MKILLIGGTGTISTSITRELVSAGHDVYLLNRGNRPLPYGAKGIRADIHDEDAARDKLAPMGQWDCVCDFIAFSVEDVQRDYRLLRGRTSQFVFISSASAYRKPPISHIITEKTLLANPYWEYSRRKIACEDFLTGKSREEGFPVTIIRPSHTYCERSIPVSVHGSKGSYQVISRIAQGKPVIIHGDGTSLWTLTHSDDFARAFVPLLGNPATLGEAIQITSDEVLSWNMIYRTIAEEMGVELHPYHVSSDFLSAVCPGELDLRGNLLGDKAECAVFDNGKLLEFVPGFKARIPFREGVRRCLEYQRAHPECRIPDEEFDKWCDRVILAVEETKMAFSGR